MIICVSIQDLGGLFCFFSGYVVFGLQVISIGLEWLIGYLRGRDDFECLERVSRIEKCNIGGNFGMVMFYEDLNSWVLCSVYLFI